MTRGTDGTWSEPALAPLDPARTVPAVLRRRAREFPEDVLVERRSGTGSWEPMTAPEVARDVDTVARGLIALGVGVGDGVAVLGSTSYEWMLLDLAVQAVRGVVVPIYQTDSLSQVRHILTDADVSVVITDTAEQAELVRSAHGPTLRHLLCLERGGLEDLRAAAGRAPRGESERRRASAGADDLASIVYTSGTTGEPKGVELTQANFVEMTRGVRHILPEILDSPDTRVLMFLPLAHVFARFVVHTLIAGRGSMGFSRDTRNLLSDISSFRPTGMLVVPRVLEKVHNAAAAKAGGGVRGKVFSWSARQARRVAEAGPGSEGVGPGARGALAVADRLVLSQVRAALGNQLRYVISGGAPLSQDLAGFFGGVGITIIQGYGLTETTGPATGQRIGDNDPSNVGRPLPGTSLRIETDGEILLRGPSLFRGYHNLPGATEEALRGGWFHTGDLGSADEEGHLGITGRKKELLVTASGKNVSPEVLEDALASHPLIGHVIVVGDARPYVGALVTLDPEMLPVWLRKKGLEPTDPAHAAQMPEVRASLDRAIARADQRVSRAESIRRYRIVDAEFSVENGYLTPSLKVRRHKVLQDLADEVDALYEESERDKEAGRLG